MLHVRLYPLLHPQYRAHHDHRLVHPDPAPRPVHLPPRLNRRFPLGMHTNMLGIMNPGVMPGQAMQPPLRWQIYPLM